MRNLLLAGSMAMVSLFATSEAFATTTEPDTAVVPKASNTGEIQLNTFFASRNEPIDWLADAGTVPDAFSPLCAFTATFVLNQSGAHLGLAWYNANGVRPNEMTDLHTIMPSGSTVGTVINSADIKNDPAYAGGLVGFALIGQQTHYSEAKWDPLCTSCTPPAPWITALIYASKITPDAYYLAFEDDFVTDTSFQNDGDFNDEVFFLTGLTCSGGGQVCDTGKPGICGPGLTGCTPAGTSCQELTPPAAKELCNGVDDDCNGMTDEGDICQAGFICDKGTCVANCAGSEFACPIDQVCSADGYCVDPSCVAITCDAGKVCIAGVCKAPCDGIVCPSPEVCRVGVCVDPCVGVTCGTNEVCDGGICVASCDCTPCATGKACDIGASGLCIEPACVGVVCAAGQNCQAGTCVDDCTGAVCPAGEECKMGACVAAPSMTTSSASATSSGALSGGFGGDSFVISASSQEASSSAGGLSGAGGASGSGGANGTGGAFKSGIVPSGCGCRLAERESDPRALLVLGALGSLVFARRRRSLRRKEPTRSSTRTR